MKLFNTKIAKLCALAVLGLSAPNLLVACEPAEQKGEREKGVIEVSKFMSLSALLRAKITDFIDPVYQIAKLRGLREWSGQEVGRHDGWVDSVGWSLDGKSIVSGGFDDKVLVWKKQEDGSWSRHEVGSHDRWVASVGWSPDGRSVVSGGSDNTVLVWTKQDDDSWSRQQVGRHDRWVASVGWSLDGKSIVSGGSDNTVLVWTKQDDGSWSRQQVGRHDLWVDSVGWSPDGKSIVSGSDGKLVCYNNTYTSQHLDVLQKVLMLDVLAHVQAGKKMEFDANYVKVYHTLPEKMKQLAEPFVSMQQLKNITKIIQSAAPLALRIFEQRQRHVVDGSRSPRDRGCSDSKDAE